MSDPYVSRSLLQRLTASQRQMLVDHIDGQVGIILDKSNVTRISLVNLKLLKYSPQNQPKPRFTALTENGRMALCMILADCADTLVQCGILETDPHAALLALRKMKNGGKFVPITKVPSAPQLRPADRA